MRNKINGNKSLILPIILIGILFTSMFFSACNDAGVETTGPTANPNVKAFDSLWVQETIDASSLCGLNLFYGSTVLRDSASKDCQLTDTSSSGIDFSLRSGDLLDNFITGFQTRFHRIYAAMSKGNFDTITVLPVARDTILPDQDFTSDDTKGGSAWDYFNAPLTGDQPVYSFYLKGKSLNFHGKNIYGILQPIYAEDTNPGVGGYSMSFRVRINFNAQNDFRLMIPGQ